MTPRVCLYAFCRASEVWHRLLDLGPESELLEEERGFCDVVGGLPFPGNTRPTFVRERGEREREG